MLALPKQKQQALTIELLMSRMRWTLASDVRSRPPIRFIRAGPTKEYRGEQGDQNH